MFFEYLSRITEPLRLSDFHSHTRALGFPEFRPPMAISPVLTFLAAPIRHLGESVGAFYVGEKEVEFTPEDEETLVMFASVYWCESSWILLVQMAPSPSQSSIPCYGAAGVWVWNQRERSLTPYSLMALIR